jgi:RHS repeat-associated protein
MTDILSVTSMYDEELGQFTGKERDAETGLDYFGARYMSAAQGRFTSPDRPFMDQRLNDPQSWNLYTYGRNNPMRFLILQGTVRSRPMQNQTRLPIRFARIQKL